MPNLPSSSQHGIIKISAHLLGGGIVIRNHPELGLAVSVTDQADCWQYLLWKGVTYMAGAYAAAHVMFYAFHGVLGLPIPFAWCVVIALVPLVNLGGCILAGTVLTWAAMIYFGLRVANWLLGRVLEWLA